MTNRNSNSMKDPKLGRNTRVSKISRAFAVCFEPSTPARPRRGAGRRRQQSVPTLTSTAACFKPGRRRVERSGHGEPREVLCRPIPSDLMATTCRSRCGSRKGPPHTSSTPCCSAKVASTVAGGASMSSRLTVAPALPLLRPRHPAADARLPRRLIGRRSCSRRRCRPRLGGLLGGPQLLVAFHKLRGELGIWGPKLSELPQRSAVVLGRG